MVRRSWYPSGADTQNPQVEIDLRKGGKRQGHGVLSGATERSSSSVIGAVPGGMATSNAAASMLVFTSSCCTLAIRSTRAVRGSQAHLPREAVQDLAVVGAPAAAIDAPPPSTRQRPDAETPCDHPAPPPRAIRPTIAGRRSPRRRQRRRRATRADRRRSAAVRSGRSMTADTELDVSTRRSRGRSNVACSARAARMNTGAPNGATPSRRAAPPRCSPVITSPRSDSSPALPERPSSIVSVRSPAQ